MSDLAQRLLYDVSRCVSIDQANGESPDTGPLLTALLQEPALQDKAAVVKAFANQIYLSRVQFDWAATEYEQAHGTKLAILSPLATGALFAGIDAVMERCCGHTDIYGSVFEAGCIGGFIEIMFGQLRKLATAYDTYPAWLEHRKRCDAAKSDALRSLDNL